MYTDQGDCDGDCPIVRNIDVVHVLQFIHDDAADTPNFPGAKATYTESMNFLLPDSYDGIPVYRVMDRQGNVINPSHDPQLPDDELLKMYKVRKSHMQMPLQETDWGFGLWCGEFLTYS